MPTLVSTIAPFGDRVVVQTQVTRANRQHQKRLWGVQLSICGTGGMSSITLPKCGDVVLNNNAASVGSDSVCHGICHANLSERFNPNLSSVLDSNPIMSPRLGSYLRILLLWEAKLSYTLCSCGWNRVDG